MDRRTFSSVLDEAVGQLEGDVRILKNQQATITANLKDLETRRNKLAQEIMELEKKKELTLKETQEEKTNILKSAQDKLNSATSRDTEASGKLAELNQKQKEADDIVKSNQGLQKNLNIQTEDIKNKVIKLTSLIKLTQETIKDM